MVDPKSSRKTIFGSRAALLAVVLGTAITSAPAPAAVNGISRYCTACWKNARLPADVWPDCTQEVFVRLLERLPATTWNDALKQEASEHRELVRAIDCVKKRVQRSKKTQPIPMEGVSDHRSGADTSRQDEWELVRKAAHEVLSERQRKIIAMSAMGYEVSDISNELNMSPSRVSDEKYKAVHRLREYLEQSVETAV
jgi:RNA polymerase sigma factor (sigma-70 family)